MAALLVHASSADGVRSQDESEKICHLLMERFSLSAHECSLLMAEGEDKNHEAVDLYQFTRTLTAELDQSGRQKFMKMMWEVILADGVVDDFEAHLIWRVSDLLGVSTRDRVLLRQEVEGGTHVLCVDT
eukprot:Platyproteum_vivax@DN16799_c0_g1_i1.p1